ncbi:hypothetical protein EON65_38485 [archaeon]|nr:MAG: hypothetical protein EON65_38485 [archaeon]
MKAILRLVAVLAILRSFYSLETWLTSCDKNGNVINLLEPQTGLTPVNSTAAFSKINIDSSQRLQLMLGFGAGIPQSSAYVLSQLKGRNSSMYWEVLAQLFGSEGAKMNFLRFPIGSCDFSLHATTYDEVKDDYDLSHFDIDRDSEVIAEVLLDAKKVNPGLKLIGK